MPPSGRRTSTNRGPRKPAAGRRTCCSRSCLMRTRPPPRSRWRALKRAFGSQNSGAGDALRTRRGCYPRGSVAQSMDEGGTRLVGREPISGSKNAVLPILAACLLTDEECRLKNVPRLEDVYTMERLLTGMGVQIRWLDPQQLQINAQRLARSEVLATMASKMRASFLLMGPLLARRGEARVAKPGGDDIGMRRVEQHLVGLRLMGARVELEGGEYVARADRLKGATIHLDMPTVTRTENLMMAAATADGITTIHNAAREPHVVDLPLFLGKMGADRKSTRLNSSHT